MVYRFFRFLSGTVALKTEGGFPERFLNLAAEQDYPLWDVTCCDGSLSAVCPCSVYPALRPIARRSSVRMRVHARRGLPFLLRPLRMRWGLAAGLLIFLVILQAFSSRVWVVRVEGNSTVPESDIRAVVEPFGIREGADFSHVNIAEVQLSALKQLPGLIWLTANQSGSTVTVVVRERETDPTPSHEEPSNLVADRDGVIVRLHVTAGQARASVGDAVSDGMLLIGGVVDSKVGPLLRHAAGEVVLRTQETLTIRVPLTETVPAPPSVLNRLSLSLFTWSIPLYTDIEPDPGYTRTTAWYPLKAFGKTLPVGWTVTRFTYPASITVTHTPEEARRLAEERLTAEETSSLANATVEKATRVFRTEADCAVITGTYTCLRRGGREEIIINQ